MPDPRLGSWERELEKSASGILLPDSRLKWEDRDKARVQVGQLVVDKIFCANCGEEAPGGTPVGSPFIFYLCEPCFDKANRTAPPGTVQIPGA